MRYTSSSIPSASVSRSVALFLICGALALPVASFAADGPFIFHSREDDGTNGGCAYPLPPPFGPVSTDCLLKGIPAPEALHLYADPGPNPDYADCFGLCGIHAVVEAEGAFFTSFDAEPGVSHAPECEPPANGVACPLPPTTDRITIIASFASAEAAPTAPVRKLGTLFIDAPAPTGRRADGASVSVNGVEIIDGAGADADLPVEFIALPEPGLPLQWLCGVLGLYALHVRRRQCQQGRRQ